MTEITTHASVQFIAVRPSATGDRITCTLNDLNPINHPMRKVLFNIDVSPSTGSPT